MEISQGKQLGVALHTINTSRASPPSQAQLSSTNYSRSRVSGFFSPAPELTLSPIEKIKSLNITFRRRENQRIERENHGLAKRLFSNPSTISKRNLDKDFVRLNNYSKMIARVKPDKPTFMGRVGSLPPMRQQQPPQRTLEGQGSAEEFD